MVEILRAPHCTTLRSLQCGASVAQNDIPGELWSCGSWRWSWSPRVGCTESLEGFMQRLACAAHGILDLFELGAQGSDRFPRLGWVGYLAIGIEALVRVDDTPGALIDRLRLLHGSFERIQRCMHSSDILAAGFGAVNQLLGFFNKFIPTPQTLVLKEFARPDLLQPLP